MGLECSFLKTDVLCLMLIAEFPASRAVPVIQIWEQWVSAGDDFASPLPPKGIFGNIWRHSWLSPLQKGACYWHVMSGGQRWAAKHPTVQETAHSFPQMANMPIVLRLREPVFGAWLKEGERDMSIEGIACYWLAKGAATPRGSFKLIWLFGKLMPGIGKGLTKVIQLLVG